MSLTSSSRYASSLRRVLVSCRMVGVRWNTNSSSSGGTVGSSLSGSPMRSYPGINHIRPTETTVRLLEKLIGDGRSDLETSQQRMKRRMALAKAITLVESKNLQHQQQADWLLTNLLHKVEPKQQESPRTETEKQVESSRLFRLGLAGPPGAGKSTFIEAFGMFLLEQADANATMRPLPSKLAVVAIDPSSNVTGGSILGDKTRMMELSRHDRAFVRPSSNGGTFGGLSAYTDDVVSLCQAAGYDLVIVESVGLGQSEIEIAESVDMLVLMVPPGGGDELQGTKKGIVEVADMLVINKADGTLLPAARNTAADYRGAMQFLRQRTEGWSTPVVLASAHAKYNLDKVWEEICKFRRLLEETEELERKRKRQGSYWMWKHLKDLITRQTRRDPHLRETAAAMERGLENGTITPRVAALHLLERLLHPSADKTE